MTIIESLQRLTERDDCKVLPPSGMPTLKQGHKLPSDLSELYSCCGGILIKPFNDKFFSWYVSSPDCLRPAVAIIHKGEMSEYERRFWSDHWASSLYVIAHTESEDELVVVDCGGQYQGIYFDGHRETFGCDDMPVIAASLSDLLFKLVEANIGSMPRVNPGSQKLIKNVRVDPK